MTSSQNDMNGHPVVRQTRSLQRRNCRTPADFLQLSLRQGFTDCITITETDRNEFRIELPSMPSLNALNVSIKKVGKDWVAVFVDSNSARFESHQEGQPAAVSMAVAEALSQFAVDFRSNVFSVVLPPGDEGQSLFRFYQFLSRLSPSLSKTT